MGVGIVIDGVSFADSGLGKVTLLSDIVIESLEIGCENEYISSSFEAIAIYNPSYTNQTGVTWSIIDGGNYATINEFGVVTINKTAKNSNITIKAVSKVNNQIFATKSVKVTYKSSEQLSLWDEALNDSEVSVYLSNATKVYELESEISFDGNTPSIELAQPITSLTENYFVLFDVTFGDNTSHTAPTVFARLSDNGNICKYPESPLIYQHDWAFKTDWGLTEESETFKLYTYDGNRYRVFICFNRATNKVYVKNLTTSQTSEGISSCGGGGTIRDAVLLYGGSVSDNNFTGTIHDFIIGTY